MNAVRTGRWRRFAPKSLRGQLLLRLLLLLAAILLLIGVTQYVWMSRFIFENKAGSVESQVLSVPGDYWEKNFNLGLPEYDPGGDGGGDQLHPGMGRGGEDGKEPYKKEKQSIALFYSDAAVAFIDTDLNLKSLTDGTGDGAASEASGAGAEGGSALPLKLSDETYNKAFQGYPNGSYRIVRNEEGGRQLVVLQPIEVHGVRGLVQVAMSTRPMTALLLRQLAIFLTIALFALGLSLLGLMPVLRRTLKPLSKLVDTVGKVDAGRLSIRVPEGQGQEEIDRLSSSFNDMLRGLEQSFRAEREAKERMRRFVADASHELRTPMTSIHGFLEVLLRGAANDAEQLEKALVSMHGETKRINKLVEDLLLLAKLDRAPEIALSKRDLAGLLLEMEPQLRLLAGGREVEIRAADGCECWIDGDRMKQVVLNLFQNAVQHTAAEGGRIRIGLSREGESAVLSIADNGPGIAEEHLPRIFDRFYRVDTSRSRKAGGSGLGLAISMSIVQSFGGTIHAASEPGQGAEFRIVLPLAEDPPSKG